MKDEYTQQLSVINSNMSRTDRKFSSAFEQRAAHIYEKAKLLIQKYPKFSPELPAAFREIMNKPVKVEKGAILKNEISMLYSELEVYDEAVFAGFLFDIYDKNEKITLSECIGASEGEVPQSIAYLKNGLADEAYNIFSQALNDCSVVYAPDFTAVCEAVYYEKTGYCILPIEGSADGRLAGFYGLIDKYELKVVLCCRVASYDGSVYTTFALCGKNPSVIEAKDINRRVEIQLRHDGQTLRRILNVAAWYGCEVVKCETLPIQDGNVDSLAFTSEDRGLCKLLYGLFLTGSRYTLLGAYGVIGTDTDN